MNQVRRCYEQYWRNPADAPPAEDPLRERRLKLLLPHLPTGARLLDVGCGDGYATRRLCDHCPHIVGMDVSLNALRAARHDQPTGRWLCASLEAELPFADASFDVLHCCEVIEHLLDVPAALKAMHRILRPGGLLFLSTPYHGRVKNLALALFGFERHFDPTGTHIRFFTRGSLQRLLQGVGFEVERITGLGRSWPVWMDMVVWARKV